MPGRSTFRSLTRLVIGSTLNGLDGISNRLVNWERKFDSPGKLPPTLSALPASTQPPAEYSVPLPETSSTDETEFDWTTYAVVGLLIKSQERLEHYARTTERATRVIGNWGDLLGGPIYRSRWMRPLRRTVDNLADHGRQQIDGWIATGRAETAYSRRLANAAVTERVDTAIEYLTANQEVQELVQSQSVGLVDEVIEETRERTVSADNLLEAVVRSLFRRTPRWELPEPPVELKESAEEHTRQLHNRTVVK